MFLPWHTGTAKDGLPGSCCKSAKIGVLSTWAAYAEYLAEKRKKGGSCCSKGDVWYLHYHSAD